MLSMTDTPSNAHTALRLKAVQNGPLSGNAKIPGDKSISHRSLMFGALAEGETVIHGLLEGEDVHATAQAMRELGAQITRDADGTWRAKGVGIGNLQQPKTNLDMGNSGTSTRLLMGLVATHPITATFTGDASLTKRPMGRIITPLTPMGATFEASEGGRLPLTVHGTDEGQPTHYHLPIASAQVKSAIMLAALNTVGTTTIVEDHPTRDHSENMLRYFGADIKTTSQENGATTITIKGKPSLKAGIINVPSDPSSAAFPVVAALINQGSEITCNHIGMSPTRNGIYTTLQEMGADISIENARSEGGEPIADIIVRGTATLRGIDVPASRVPSMIDEFPILAMAAACAKGTTRMTGLAELRVKESDRLLVVAEGLKACGVNLEMGEDSLTIHGTGTPPQGGATIDAHLDHRIAMSFLILSTVTEKPITIDDASPIKTSFPDFVDLMNGLGARIETD